MKIRNLKRAIGISNGKTLMIQNDCGSAYIEQEISDTGKTTYRVETDGYLDRVFNTPEAALAFALRDLASSMAGSLNR